MSNLFFDQNSQLGILTYMLADRTLRAMAIDALHPTDFDGVDRKLFGLIYEAGGEFSPFTAELSPEINDRITEGQSLRLDDPDESLFKSWIENLQAMTKRRKIRVAAQTALSMLTPESDPDKISMIIVEEIATIANRENAQSDISIGDAAILSNETEQQWADGDSFADSVATGFKGLDRATGGAQRGHVSIIAGMESMGKTSLAMSIGLNVARRKERVYIFSMDMPAPKLAARLQQTISGVSAKALRFPKDMIKEYGETEYQSRRKRFRDAGDQLADLNQYLTINPSMGLTAAQMYSKAMMHHAISPIDMIIFDFLGLDGATDDNALASLNASLRGLKLMAKHFNCPVIVLAQFSMGIKNRPDRVPNNDDLKGSSDIKQIAEAIWFVYRPAFYYDPVSGYHTKQIQAQAKWCDDNNGNSFIKIGKGRDSGMGGRVILNFHEDTATFTDTVHSGVAGKVSPPKQAYKTADQFNR